MNNLRKTINNHNLWIVSGGAKGQQAVLRGANLRWANLRGADLRGPN